LLVIVLLILAFFLGIGLVFLAYAS
jgi:hypothetical protein